MDARDEDARRRCLARLSGSVLVASDDESQLQPNGCNRSPLRAALMALVWSVAVVAVVVVVVVIVGVARSVSFAFVEWLYKFEWMSCG